MIIALRITPGTTTTNPPKINDTGTIIIEKSIGSLLKINATNIMDIKMINPQICG